MDLSPVAIPSCTFFSTCMQHGIATAHNIDEAMSNYHNTLSHRRAGNGRSYAGRARGSAPNQILLDFDRPAEAEPVATLPAAESPLVQFARRLATLLEADPSVKFDNTAIGRLAQEILGSSAGHGRDAYDAAEAGFNIYLHRMGLDLGNVSRRDRQTSRCPSPAARPDPTRPDAD